MSLTLINMRSGESHAVDPDRALVGSAAHADIPLPADSAFLAALIVEYPSGWVVHALSDEPPVTLNGQAIPAGQRVTPRHEDMLAVEETRFQFDFAADERVRPPARPGPARVYTCHVTVRAPDGLEEFRAVDHDLLFGRLAVCHVHYADTKLSRMNALLGCDAGDWWVFNLARGPLGRRQAGDAPMERIDRRAVLVHGDELAVGPLLVRFEVPANPVRDAAPFALAPEPEPYSPEDESMADLPTSSLEAPTPADEPAGSDLHLAGLRLDKWLKRQEPQPPDKAGWGGGLLKKLTDFWNDTPETVNARKLAHRGQLREAFDALEKAIRDRPDNPALLRELYRLYKLAEFDDLCYRPLRHIEKVLKARGKPDPWVFEELAQVCTALGPTDLSMFDRAIEYWTKLEQLSKRSCSREKQDTMGQRALVEGGFAGGKK